LQLDAADNTLELVGEDIIDHTPLDETVIIKLGSAFEIVGERRQVAFDADHNSERMEETIEVVLRNHKGSEIEVLVKETMFRWANNDILESNQTYERQDARTVNFQVLVPANGETIVRYRVRYSWQVRPQDAVEVLAQASSRPRSLAARTAFRMSLANAS
jgi:hypothetical protein